MNDLSPRDKKRLETINKKGLQVATKLAELKAKKDINFEQLAKLFGDPSDDKRPNETPEERLRRYLDTINAARKRLLEGDYGKCLGCGKPFSDLELDEMPWADYCAPCAGNY